MAGGEMEAGFVEIIKHGSHEEQNEVFKKLYAQYYPRTRQLVLNNNGNEQDAQDVFQESLIIAIEWIRDNKFREQSTIGTFIYAVCRNIWLKKLKRKHRRTVDLIEVENFENNEIDALSRSIDWEQRELLKEAIRRLKKDCEKILTDFYYHNISMRQIALSFQLGSEQAARNKKYRCLKYLMKTLEKLESGQG